MPFRPISFHLQTHSSKPHSVTSPQTHPNSLRGGVTSLLCLWRVILFCLVCYSFVHVPCLCYMPWASHSWGPCPITLYPQWAMTESLSERRYARNVSLMSEVSIVHKTHILSFYFQILFLKIKFQRKPRSIYPCTCYIQSFLKYISFDS